MGTKGGEYVTIENGIHALKVGSRIFVNDWGNEFIVCGVSDNFVVAYRPETHEYTIIPKNPAEYTYNGIPAGSFVCSTDDLIFGYMGGYHFDAPEWIEKYLGDLESGRIEISWRNRAHIVRLYIVGN